MPVQLVVLNHNGRELLAECLPSVIRAAEVYGDARVAVIDNASSDGSVRFLRERFPAVAVFECENRGLSSFNEVLPKLDCDIALLLNSDIKLDDRAVEPLVAPILVSRGTGGPRVFMTAPLCYRFDGRTYEGFRTAVDWRYGLVRATAFFDGHAGGILREGDTASVGAAMAVDRRLFTELGGFDPIYLPGRIEDLDLCFRAHMAGHQVRYVPAAVAYHRGHATFGAVHGDRGSMHLAIRNTLLFQWKNLRHPWHVARHLAALPARVLYDVGRAPWRSRLDRFSFLKALTTAIVRIPGLTRSRCRTRPSWRRETQFFRRFSPRAMSAVTPPKIEDVRAGDYPISRYLWRPLAARAAARVATTRMRPWHATLMGLVAAVAAAIAIVISGGASLFAAGLVLLAWFFDRFDGQLARRQATASPRGAWLDANVDELVDLGLHVASATAAATQVGDMAWGALIAFLMGKYLFMYGLSVEDASGEAARPNGVAASRGWRAWPRKLYHLPANADVRVHLFALALVTGGLATELWFVAVYYNLRWMIRYVLVPRRLAGARQTGVAA